MSKRKYTHIYRHKPKTFAEANDLIDRYIHFYNYERIQNKTGVAPLMLRHSAYTDIQLKTLSQRIKVFNMKIIMRRDSIIFHFENNRIDNAVRRCLSN